MTLTATLPNATSFIITTNAKSYTEALTLGEITSDLRDKFWNRGVLLASDLVVTSSVPASWTLVSSNETYFISASGNDLTVTQKTTQLLGIVQTLLKPLGLPVVVKPIIDFLLQLLGDTIPYLMLAAMVALLMVIGRYCGIVVRSLVGSTGDDIPRTLAISTTVRNVSAALIVAVIHFS